MFCENCGSKLADGDMFCQNCGAKTGNVSAENVQDRYVASSTGHSPAGKVKGIGYWGAIITAALMMFLIIVPSQVVREEFLFQSEQSFSMLKIFEFWDYLGTEADEAMFLYLFVFPMFLVLLLYGLYIYGVVKGKKKAKKTVFASVIYVLIALIWVAVVMGTNEDNVKDIYSISPALKLGMITAILNIIFAVKLKKE